MIREPQAIFLVVRRTWEVGDCQGFANPEERVPVRAFVGRAEAEAHCAALEDEAWREFDTISLFHGNMGNYRKEVRVALTRLGWLTIDQDDDYMEWLLFEHGPKVTVEQRLAIGEAVPQCRIFEVVESTLVD